MAEFQKVANERKRMCDSYEICSNGCPLGKTANGAICSSWMFANPVLAEDAIMKWSAEHPKKTNRQKFVEVFGCEIVTHEIHDAIPGHAKILNASDEEFEEWLNSEYKGGQDD